MYIPIAAMIFVCYKRYGTLPVILMWESFPLTLFSGKKKEVKNFLIYAYIGVDLSLLYIAIVRVYIYRFSEDLAN